MKRISLDSVITKNGETVFSLTKKSPNNLEYIIKKLNTSSIYMEDIVKIKESIPDINLSEEALHLQSIKEQIHRAGSFCQIKQLRVRVDIPFTPDSSQVIYVEGGFEPKLNISIFSQFDTIASLFTEVGKNFIYLPVTSSKIKESFHYYCPSYEGTVKIDMTSYSLSEQIFSYCIDDIEMQAGLIRYKGVEGNYYLFSYYIFDKPNDDDVLKYFEWYVSALEDSYSYSVEDSYSVHASPYHSYIDNPDDNADYDFDSESKEIIEEIRDRINKLKQKGVNELILKSLFTSNSVKLSRLVITNEYKIFLPDYNNLEITMYPLPKAVFILFLNYPNGILFKDLPDYRDELIAIYKSISGRESIEGMEKSIDDIVNPTLNSINEKCSRIREAFVRHFDESIAKNYFITGSRASPKKIVLDRQLLVLKDSKIKFRVARTPFEYIKHEHPYNKYSPENPLFEDDLPY